MSFFFQAAMFEVYCDTLCFLHCKIWFSMIQSSQYTICFTWNMTSVVYRAVTGEWKTCWTGLATPGIGLHQVLCIAPFQAFDLGTIKIFSRLYKT